MTARNTVTGAALGVVLGCAAMAMPVAQAADMAFPEYMKEMKGRTDKNHDGMVTKKEFMDTMGALFDKMDKERKGMLNASQFEFLLRELRRTDGG